MFKTWDEKYAYRSKDSLLYLTHLSKQSKYSTLKRRLASINVMHKYKGHYLDTKHPIIVENLLGIKRQIGVHQTGKKPILINHLKKLLM